MHARLLALALLASLLVAVPSASAQVRRGANLNRPANMTYGCETLPTTDFAGNRAFLPSRQGTCTYLGLGSIANGQQESAQAAGPGVATRVLVKAGPRVGPMQATVLQATRSTSVGAACCFWAGQSRVFTPRPNAVTAIPVRLPMRADLNAAAGIETVDYLGLTVLAPGVPVPMHDEGNPGDITRPGATAFFPHVRPGDERADGAGVIGVTPLLAFDYQRLCGAAAARVAGHTGPVRAAQGRCAPLLQAGGSARVRRGRARLRIACNLPIACKGALRLQSKKGGGRAFGRAKVSLAPGKSKTLRVKLNRRGRALLRRKKRAKAWASARLTGNGQSATVKKRVTLKR